MARTYAGPGCTAPRAIAGGATVAAVKAGRSASEKTQKSQLEIRELQTRVFDTPDSVGVLKTMLSVLQDDGFIVTQANTELGEGDWKKAVEKKKPKDGWPPTQMPTRPTGR